MQLLPPANNLAVSPPAATTTEASGGSISRGRDPRGSGACCWRSWCCFDASIFHLIISAFSSMFLLFCFLVIFRTYFVCAYSYLVPGFRCCCHARCIVFSGVLLYPAYVCDVFCFVDLDGCEHEYSYTTNGFIRPGVGYHNNVCLVAKKSWYDCSTVRNIGTREAFRQEAASIVRCNFGPAGRIRGSRERSSDRQL